MSVFVTKGRETFAALADRRTGALLNSQATQTVTPGKMTELSFAVMIAFSLDQAARLVMPVEDWGVEATTAANDDEFAFNAENPSLAESDEVLVFAEDANTDPVASAEDTAGDSIILASDDTTYEQVNGVDIV